MDGPKSVCFKILITMNYSKGTWILPVPSIQSSFPVPPPFILIPLSPTSNSTHSRVSHPGPFLVSDTTRGHHLVWLLGNIGKLPQCSQQSWGRGSAVRMVSCPTYRINSKPPPPPLWKMRDLAWNCFAHSEWRGQTPPLADANSPCRPAHPFTWGELAP